ncbi:MAG: M48 family metallopeptidase [Burkholderiaceae bacterium]|jgi:Zn-dependent protease with chaperone function|nr:M48 family metallopeptidase [Burkholderiaceae bacterium]
MSRSPAVAAAYFDGQSSRRHSVELTAQAGLLQIAGLAAGAPQRTIPLSAIQISEPQGSAPRTLRFDDGAHCEIGQDQALRQLLDALGHQETPVVRLQSRWHWSVTALALVLILLAAGYQWALPWGAKQIAPLVPVATLAQLSDGALQTLDKYMLEPSHLPPERQQNLQRGFAQLAASDPALAQYGAHLRLRFRSLPGTPNAFALPDGQIVLFDELVTLQDMRDDEILAVLAHELGHVRQRHGMRRLIQSSVVAAVTAAYLGDVSVVIGSLTTVVLESAYSRDMEREADAYAVATLQRLNANPDSLATALEKLEAFYVGKKHSSDGDDKKYTSWIESHPDTQERAMRIRGQWPKD